MNSRVEQKNIFLMEYFNNSDFIVFPLPNDASFRSYSRVLHQSDSFILMDSPPDIYQLSPFIKIAKFLSMQGFSAPDLYHIDEKNGLLLLEDYGSQNVTKYLSKENAKVTYRLIVDLLLALKDRPIPNGLSNFSNQLLLTELEVYIDWYIPYTTGYPMNNEKREKFFYLWKNILDLLPKTSLCLVLRDYHVDNMMMLDRPGIKALGLLDFQDALIGSPIYDLVSVLEDARYDVPSQIALDCINYYADKNKDLSKEDIILSFHILGAQRNMRILGVFARKFVRDKADSYLKFMPRVLKYLENDLSHPMLKELKQCILNVYPSYFKN